SLWSLGHSFSFAPLGLALVPLATHGLRRGLHSCAASRLLPWAAFLRRFTARASAGPLFRSTSSYDTDSSGTRVSLPLFPALKSARENSAVPPGLESILPVYPALN